MNPFMLHLAMLVLTLNAVVATSYVADLVTSRLRRKNWMQACIDDKIKVYSSASDAELTAHFRTAYNTTRLYLALVGVEVAALITFLVHAFGSRQ